MATTIAVPPAAPEPQPQMSAISRVFGVLFSPQKTFEDIVRKPGWLLPIVLLTDSQHGGELWLESAGQLARITSASKSRRVRRARNCRADQKEQRIEAGAKFTPISTYAFGVCGPLVIALIFALVMWGAYQLAWRSEHELRHGHGHHCARIHDRADQ